eukprot:TRINITY_DN656_c0_g2_i1.p1 TRINITY_DN656_c0_g2~~TRINITY_DN656_c0_g2_i1.p1  ORF type:complete len:1058 (+),score=370.09 TRINITY_DN656_c0_g2_i1:96-3269(+)
MGCAAAGPPLLVAALVLSLLPVVECRRRTNRQQVEKPDLYQTMNLTRGASIKQIKTMYRKWSRMLHPDVTSWPKELARKKLIEVTEAYEVLGDEDRKKTYDGSGEIDIGTKPLHWQANSMFAGETDVHVFTNGAALRRMLARNESWMLFFWQAECHECVGHADTYQKYATRMKGIANVGSVDCTNMVPECRKLAVDTNKLPQIKLWLNKETTLYSTKYGKIEVQSLVEWSAQRLLTEAASLTHSYVPPPKKGKKGKKGKTPTFPADPAEDQVWPLVSFEYDACMDCRTELTLAVDGLRGYCKTPMRALRVDCLKNAKFCKKHAPKQVGLAWNVGRITHKKGAGRSEVSVELMEQKRQFDARDLLGFALSKQKSDLGAVDSSLFQTIAWGAPAKDESWLSSMWGSEPDGQKAATEDAWAIAFVGQNKESERSRPYLEMVASDSLGWKSDGGSPVHVATFDCAANKQVCSRALGVFRGQPKLPQMRLYPATKAAKAEPVVVSVSNPASMTEKIRQEVDPLEIVRLDPQTYQERFADVSTRGNWYVLWSAGDWCPPCIQMRDPWRQMARIVGSENRKTKITVGVVDCDANKYLCQKNGIDSYPTMRFHPEGGGHSDFGGERTPEKLFAWGREQIGSKVSMMGQELAQVARRKTGKPFVVLFTAGGWCPPCGAIGPKYNKAAKKLNPLQLGKVDCDAHRPLCERFGIKSFPTVVVYANGPKAPAYCRKVAGKKKQKKCSFGHIHTLSEQEKSSAVAISTAVKKYVKDFEYVPPEDDDDDDDDDSDGPLRFLKESEYNNLVLKQKEGPQDWFVLWTGGEWCPPCQQMKKPFRDLAYILQDEAPNVNIGVMDCDVHGALCRQQRMRSLPTAFFHPAGKQQQAYPGQRSAEAMADWLSEQLELAQGGSNVLNPGRGMVRLTKDGKPLLALFSAGEWCPPCMAIYARFAKVSKKLPDLRLAQIDCDEYRDVCVQFGINSYPSVIFYGKQLATTKSGCVHHIKSDGTREQGVWDCSSKSWVRILPQDDKHSAAAIINFAQKNLAKIKELEGGGADSDDHTDHDDEL